MRNIYCDFATILPRLFFVFGTRPAHVTRAADLFDQGKWEKLWERVLKEGAKTRARTANNPRKAVVQPSAQRDRYAQRCARKGNLSKAAKVLYKASIPACNEDTVERLRELHPPGPLDFNKDFFPSIQQSAEFWESADGCNIIEEAFNISNVRTHFRTRPPLDAPDPDGWRGREHISWLFMNDDDEAQQRIINNLMLPYATGDFHPDYLHEHAGGRLSAFLKPYGIRVRPIGCASASAKLILRMPFKCIPISSVLVIVFLARHRVLMIMGQCRWGTICLISRLSSHSLNISAPWVVWPAAIAIRITMVQHIISTALVVEYRGTLWRC